MVWWSGGTCAASGYVRRGVRTARLVFKELYCARKRRSDVRHDDRGENLAMIIIASLVQDRFGIRIFAKETCS